MFLREKEESFISSSQFINNSSDQSSDPLLSMSSIEMMDFYSSVTQTSPTAEIGQASSKQFKTFHENSDSIVNSGKPQISFQEKGKSSHYSRRSSQDSRFESSIESKINIQMTKMSSRKSRRSSQGSRRNSQVLQSRINLQDSRKNSEDLVGSSPALSSGSSLSIDHVWRIGSIADEIKEETADISSEYPVATLNFLYFNRKTFQNLQFSIF